jgi:multiple sugar transport system ATP-binding protein
MTTSITLEDITKRYEDVTAVDGVELSVAEGEFLVLVGPSGCGKSTTLRIVSGLEESTSGRIHLGERDVTDVPPEDRNVAMVFQNYALYPHMTARRNMTFGLGSATDFSTEEGEHRVEEAAETLDIADLLDRKPSELSGGEQQRVAIGRALVRDPDVFLLDEPLSNLDAKLRVQMRAELAELHAELGTTTVYVTHDQTEAMTLGDRVAVMNDGHIEQVDPPQTLYDYPATRFVAEFIGDPAMNTLPAAVRSTGDGYVAEVGAGSVALPARDDVGSVAGGRAVLGVRPEDLHVDPDGPLSLTVRVTEPLGDTLLIHGDVDDHELKVQLDPRSDIRQGDTVRLGVDDRRLHLFDATTGEALYHSDGGRGRETHRSRSVAGERGGASTD